MSIIKIKKMPFPYILKYYSIFTFTYSLEIYLTNQK
jgi:hypothetical protein